MTAVPTAANARAIRHKMEDISSLLTHAEKIAREAYVMAQNDVKGLDSSVIDLIGAIRTLEGAVRVERWDWLDLAKHRAEEERKSAETVGGFR